VDFLAEAAGDDTWVLPSAGPDYGKLIDQAAILRSRAFPTAMLLPRSFPSPDAGLADGIRRFSDALGKPGGVYLKSSGSLAPSAGPDYAKLIDQAAILRSRAFPPAMLLPMSFPYTDAGLADGIRRFSDALGKPVVVYLKSSGYLAPQTVAGLVEEGRIVALKYAVVRDDPADDPYLSALLAAVDSRWLVSGIGERPAITHFRQFGLKSFTSG